MINSLMIMGKPIAKRIIKLFIADHFFGKENYATWNMNMSMTRKNLPSTPFC